MQTDIEVHIDLDMQVHRVGTLYAPERGPRSLATFHYHADWIDSPTAFSLEPALQMGRGAFAPPSGQMLFGSIGDSSPDSWGRRLMQRAERRLAAREGRAVRTLSDIDYLLGVSDIARLGALRFKGRGDTAFQAEASAGVPPMIELGRLMAITERILRDEESDEDLQMIFAPGSSLGGARPKASIIDSQGRLAIAKFAKDDDGHRIELWEAVALTLARGAGISVAEHQLQQVAGKSVLLSRRFDRDGERRIPFLSALSMLALKDGERSSYPEIVDTLSRHGANASDDAAELYRRMAFNVLISNVDDHLRNHGFLWSGKSGWCLSPAYDLNPTPSDLKARILSTNIDGDEGTCDIELVRSVAGYFGLGLAGGDAIIRSVANAVAGWRETARSTGARASEITRMASAFDHQDLRRALTLG
jgi:serine/threonine-protein kinase HipA